MKARNRIELHALPFIHPATKEMPMPTTLPPHPKHRKLEPETRALMLAGISHDIRTPMTKLRLAMAMSSVPAKDAAFAASAEGYSDHPGPTTTPSRARSVSRRT